MSSDDKESPASDDDDSWPEVSDFERRWRGIAIRVGAGIVIYVLARAVLFIFWDV